LGSAQDVDPAKIISSQYQTKTGGSQCNRKTEYLGGCTNSNLVAAQSFYLGLTINMCCQVETAILHLQVLPLSEQNQGSTILGEIACP